MTTPDWTSSVFDNAPCAELPTTSPAKRDEQVFGKPGNDEPPSLPFFIVRDDLFMERANKADNARTLNAVRAMCLSECAAATRTACRWVGMSKPHRAVDGIWGGVTKKERLAAMAKAKVAVEPDEQLDEDDEEDEDVPAAV